MAKKQTLTATHTILSQTVPITPTPLDMAPSQSAKSAKAKKEKVFHPESRKAQQLARNALRRDKRSNQSSKRSQKHDSRGAHPHEV